MPDMGLEYRADQIADAEHVQPQKDRRCHRVEKKALSHHDPPARFACISKHTKAGRDWITFRHFLQARHGRQALRFLAQH